MRQIRFHVEFEWKKSSKYCPCRIQWWEWISIVSIHGYPIPSKKWGDLSGEHARLTRPAGAGWPEAPTSQSPGEASNFSQAMDNGGDSDVSDADANAEGSTGTTDSDFPGFPQGFGGLAKMAGEAWNIYGEIRIYSGCKGGKKARLRWHVKVDESGASGEADGTGKDPGFPAMPEGGPPLNPGTDGPAGTPVGDEGSDSEADQEDVNTGSKERYGSTHQEPPPKRRR